LSSSIAADASSAAALKPGSTPVVPHALGDLGDPGVLSKDPAAAAAAEVEDVKRTGSQADALERGVPSARVVRIAHAPHVVFQTNEQDVLREMNAFLARLP
jgi:hypothetical protein